MDPGGAPSGAVAPRERLSTAGRSFTAAPPHAEGTNARIAPESNLCPYLCPQPVLSMSRYDCLIALAADGRTVGPGSPRGPGDIPRSGIGAVWPVAAGSPSGLCCAPAHLAG